MTAPHVPVRPALRVRTAHVFALALSLFVPLAGFAGAAAPVAAEEAVAQTSEQSYVSSISDRAIKILTDKVLDGQQREKSFHDLILANIAIDRIAPFALGRYAQAMRSSGHYEEYVQLFGEYIARVYAARLAGYSGEHLKVDRSIPHGEKDFVVFSTILPGAEGGDPIAVNWRLEKSGDSFKIVDVQVVGAWMSIEQQSQFASIISNNNRDVSKLLDYLRDQTSGTATPTPPTGATPK
jgi:phospholipid transport system substrate-binding protein